MSVEPWRMVRMALAEVDSKQAARVIPPAEGGLVGVRGGRAGVTTPEMLRAYALVQLHRKGPDTRITCARHPRPWLVPCDRVNVVDFLLGRQTECDRGNA